MMPTRPVDLSDVAGETTPAELVQCKLCKGELWLIYFVHGKHQHIQCAECGVSYCAHEGPCDWKVTPTEEAADG